MRVGIVGGGITGLALTHALARRGIDSILFERSDRLGGVIRTSRVDGTIFEVGPQRTRLVPSIRRLVDELDLTDRVLPARKGARLRVWTRGRLRPVPTTPAGLIGGDLLTPAGRARVAFEPLTSGLKDDETVAAYFKRKTGPEAYGALFGPLVSATFASDPARMPARHTLPLVLAPLGVRRSLLAAARRWRPAAAPACTFTEGMSELVHRLGDVHADRIATGREVAVLARDPRGIVAASTDGSEERVDHVVLTTEAHVAARLLDQLDPDSDAPRVLDKLTYNEIAVVGLRARPGEGFGFQTAFGSGWRTRGVTWAGWLFGRGDACTAYLGGGMDPDVAGWSDDEVSRTAAREFEEIHGRLADVVSVDRARLPAFDRGWDALGEISLPGDVTLAANYTGRLGISARVAQAEAVADSLPAEV